MCYFVSVACIVLYFRFLYLLFFFFKQKTAYEMRISDWSSDVCSSDLRREKKDGASTSSARTEERVMQIYGSPLEPASRQVSPSPPSRGRSRPLRRRGSPIGLQSRHVPRRLVLADHRFDRPQRADQRRGAVRIVQAGERDFAIGRERV